MIEVREYIDTEGRSSFGVWFEGLNASAAAKVRTALARMEAGNLSNVKSVGGGVQEFRIQSGPGFLIYFGREGNRLIILLGGGTKRRQQQDIENAQSLWQEHKDRKRREE